MELEKGSTLHLQQPQTPSVWTDEKHLHFLNTMEASFVRTMLHHYGLVSTQPLRLDRYLPDTSESTLDSKPNRTRTRPNHHAPSGTQPYPLPQVCLTKQHANKRNFVIPGKYGIYLLDIFTLSLSFFYSPSFLSFLYSSLSHHNSKISLPPPTSPFIFSPYLI
uniref:Uncharacterized protein n=1 Tax=Cajanus cajan TaxID=3821 RepID=A0A151U6E4_CAJCA|nr:hypothetical protein KK1_007586 [Cajanus cajan]